MRACKRSCRPALCLDEAIRSARDAEAALELRRCRIINIKVGRVGGFTEAIAVHDVARRAGCRSGAAACWSRASAGPTMWRSPRCANFRLPGDVSASKRYWKEDIIEPEVTVSPRGTIAVSDQAGRGYALRKDLIEKLTVRKEELRG